jgi:hypothetical protein
MSEETEADPDLSFSTAADLRAAADETSEQAGDGADAFGDLRHPDRTFPRAGGMKYEGATVIELSPPSGPTDEAALAALVREVLAADRYRFGDWFDLPLPVYLVHDNHAGDTFRVAVRESSVELHVRSATGADGLRAFRDRLSESVAGPTDGDPPADWSVSRRTE